MGSLTPTIGRIVHVATPEGYNGVFVQPAIITRVWNANANAETGCIGMVNVMVLPDMNVPFGKQSIQLYHTERDAMGDGSLPLDQKCWWPERS